MGAIRDWRQLFLSLIFRSPSRFLSARVSHADLTTVVLDAAARTAFPATRPEAQRRMQPRMAEQRRTKISRSRCSFCSAELTVKMRRTNDDARRAVTTVRRPVVIQPAETMRRIIA
ncbi:hypothetical protein ALC53_03400 [Atta colombica]|uniref:Uncharacterized protein n=1 Tax=Atta colombica TaxID=520822 RepID=A0A195BPD2_9HYME|nr:hypothetical protein ALC53_03400 [Atta colombica]